MKIRSQLKVGAPKSPRPRKSLFIKLDPALKSGEWEWTWRDGIPTFRSLVKKRSR